MKLVDVKNDAGNMDQLTTDLTQAVQSRQDTDLDAGGTPAVVEAPVAPAPASVVPPKLAGKTPEEIASMYANLESAYGRMANDLGSQRKLTDRLLDLKRSGDLEQNSPPAAAPVTVTGTDLLDNPTEVLDKYFEGRMAQLQQGQAERLNEVEVSLAEQNFSTKHGDISQLGQDAGFAEYVNGTALRQNLAQKAAGGDYEAADQLLDEWKSAKVYMTPATTDTVTETTTQEETKVNPLEAARQASLEGSTTSGGKSSGKTYRRADLIELKLTKPQIYSDPAFQEEIMLAYREGRVK